MKAAEIFSDCYGRYRVLREWLKNSAGTVPAIDLENPLAGYQWRPEPGRAREYIVDFERIGRRALARSEWKGRLKLFNVYFVRGADYHRAVRLVGVSENTFDYWYREVKRELGGEFSRAGLYPPSQYFLARTARIVKVKRAATARRKPARQRAAASSF
ncbi:MAG TPA: hypothetical protein VI216_06935 [Candidatus Acidoferrales bacterium]